MNDTQLSASPDALDHPVEDIVGYRLRRAQLAVFQRFAAGFAELDLRPGEYSVLALVAANPGRKQAQLAAALGIKRANLVTLVNGLEGRGLIERRAGGDRRANALFLTAAGSRFARRMQELQDAFEADCVRRLGGADQKAHLLTLLNRLID